MGKFSEYNAVVDQITSRVPAAVTTAQAALETGYGKFVAVDIKTGMYSFNLFGIKGSGPNGSILSRTREENHQGIWEPVQARFRAYHNFEESIEDHSKFFYDNINRYGPAFQTKTPAEFARAITRAGYATDSRYANKLICLMRYWGVKIRHR